MSFPVGNKLGGRKKGSKNQTTILKEERRAIFDEEVSKMYLETIKKAKPEYLLDQFIGKAEDKLKVEGELKTGEVIAPELIAIAKEELKKRLAEKHD